MNTLSWLIYAAEVSERLSSFFVIGGGAVLVTATFMLLPTSDEYIASPEFRSGYRRLYRRGAPAVLLAIIIGLALPSSRTIYMIAASEAGEAVVTSPDAIEMMGDLKAIIKKRLKDELGGDK